MKDVSYYLEKGFDEKMARYFAAGRREITEVIPKDDFCLILKFDNGEKRKFDMKPVIEPGTVFAFLSDEKNFKRVYLDDCGCVSWDIDPNVDSREVWNNKVDISSDACYVDSIPLNSSAQTA